jgi:hypothetical protein
MTEKRGDIVYTPDWVARDMVEFFKPTGRILEPCRGSGAFMRFLPTGTDWCEITEGRDFFHWKAPVDWVISNPPYSLTRKWFNHTFAITREFAYLVPLRNVFSGYGFVREIYEWGGIVNLRVYGTGGSVGFPMGNAIGAIHARKAYGGQCTMSFYNPTRFNTPSDPLEEAFRW